VSVRAPLIGADERRLLVTCARLELESEHEERVHELVRGPLDWVSVLFYARLHSVAPLLHHHLKRLAVPEAIPTDARRRLLALYQRAAYQNRVFSAENAAIAEALERRGVPIIVLKGLPLVELVYGSLAMRPLIDLDLLVQSAAARDADAVLRRCGYARRPIPALRGLYRRCCPRWWYVKNGNIRLAVSLQTAFVNWPRLHGFAAEQVWADARPWPQARGRPLLLSAVDLVLFLCQQADNQGYFNRVARERIEPDELLFAEWSNNRLIRFTDIREVVRREGKAIDWDLLTERARETGIDDAVHTSLSITEALLGPTVPVGVLESLRPAAGSRLRSALLRAARAHGREGTHGRTSRSAPQGIAWSRLGARRQLELLRAVSLAELVFPPPSELRRFHRRSSRARFAADYVAHSARALIASLAGFAESFLLGLGRLVRRRAKEAGAR
jgi:Uncharacterised nucleotidyltransferase